MDSATINKTKDVLTYLSNRANSKLNEAGYCVCYCR